MTKVTRELLENNVIEWAKEKNILKKENQFKQALKTGEEFGELCSALLKGDENKILDSIGDVEVCLTILKEQLGYEQDVPLALAWNEIKDRTGQEVDGVFVKDE